MITVDMSEWKGVAIRQEERDRWIAKIAASVLDGYPNEYSTMSLSGDSMVLAVVDSETGLMTLYDCQIRRSSGGIHLKKHAEAGGSTQTYCPD